MNSLIRFFGPSRTGDPRFLEPARRSAGIEFVRGRDLMAHSRR
jgi:hypothetical protein